MMFLLEITSNCTDPALAGILYIIKKFMDILWIVGPICAIVGAAIALVKLMSNPDEKKYKNIFRNMIIALLILFFLPAIVNVVMNLFDDNFEVAACWNQSGEIYDSMDDSKNPAYIVPDIMIERNLKDAVSGETTNLDSQIEDLEEATSDVDASSSFNKINIFVGDSRTVGMMNAVSKNNDEWICKVSSDYNWLVNIANSSVENKINEQANVFILMGINDLHNYQKYISYINDLAIKVSEKGGRTYFVSVNPTNRSADYLNDDIDEFNLKVKNGLSSYVTYIDTNSYLMNNGFSSSDGIHYTNTTYKQIYSLIKSNI